MTMKDLDLQLKLMTLVMEICARRNVPIHYKATGIYMQIRTVAGVSGPYCDSNIKSRNETFAAHLIFKQYLVMTWKKNSKPFSRK